MTWQPIASGPEELPECLLWCADTKAVGRRDKPAPIGCVMGRFMFGRPYGSGMNGDWTFSHWMPLPPPPPVASEGE